MKRGVAIRGSRAVMKRVPTGIPGLDELIEGGFPEGRGIIVAGMSGTGKTTFAVQYVYRGVKDYGENGVLVTLNETPEQIREEMYPLGWKLQKAEKDGNLALVDLSPIRYTRPEMRMRVGTGPVLSQEFKLDTVVSIVRAHAEKINAKRVAIDPITPLTLQGKDPYEKSLNFMRLLQAFEEAKCTVVMTADMKQPPEKVPDSIGFLLTEEASAPGIIILRFVPREDEVVHAIQIVKMRGTNHDKKMHPYQITGKGIVVYPKRSLYPKFF